VPTPWANAQASLNGQAAKPVTSGQKGWLLSTKNASSSASRQKMAENPNSILVSQLQPHTAEAELVTALHAVLTVFSKLPNPTPWRWLSLLENIILNVAGPAGIAWPCIEARSAAIDTLFQDLRRELAKLDFEQDHPQIAGHG
jgi:hypothetical protein